MVLCSGRYHVTQLCGFMYGECQSHLKEKVVQKENYSFLG